MRTITALAFALLIAAPGAARDRKPQDLASRLAGWTAQAPRSCINLRPGLGSETVDGAIIYRQSRTEWFVNRPDDGRCDNLDNRHAFVSRTPSTQLCRGDIIQVIDPPLSLPLNTCALSDFVPYRRGK